MFLFKNSTLPSKFNNFFSANNQIHNYNTRSAQSFRLPLSRTNTRRFSVYFQGPKFYNSLNAKITKSSSYTTLKKSLRNFFSIGINLMLHSALFTFIFVQACTTFAGRYCHIRLAFF